MGPCWKRSCLAPSSLFEDHAAHDIGGHKIGRELNARILQLHGAREGAQQSSLSQSRYAFQ